MIRIFAIGLVVIVTLFSLPTFASEEDKSIHQNSEMNVSAAKTDKERPDNKIKDFDGSLKSKEEPERVADHDHYGKFLIFRALAGGGTRR